MLSERDIKVLKVMIPNLSFMITKMVNKTKCKLKLLCLNLFYFYFKEISRTSFKITNALGRIFVCPIQLEIVCRVFKPDNSFAYMLYI